MIQRHDAVVVVAVLWHVCLQKVRQGMVAERLENLRQEYISFLYGFPAVGGGAKPTDLSTDQSGLFQSDALAHLFFRWVGGRQHTVQHNTVLQLLFVVRLCIMPPVSGVWAGCLGVF